MIGIGIGTHRRRFQDFLPDNVDNLAVWLRADKGITKGFSDMISQWDFENGTFRGVSNVAQSTGANQPTHVISDVNYNGQSVVSFDGNDFLDGIAFSSVIAQPTTIFIVGNFGGINEAFLDATGGANRNVVFTSANFSINAGATLAGSANNTNVHIFECIFNGGGSELILDGTSDVAGNAGANSLGSLRIGQNSAGALSLTGKVAEITIYDALASAADRLRIRTYLSARYNITI